jgi:hypothetical protein
MILVSPFDYICHALNSRFVIKVSPQCGIWMSYFSSVKLDDCFLEEQYAGKTSCFQWVFFYFLCICCIAKAKGWHGCWIFVSIVIPSCLPPCPSFALLFSCEFSNEILAKRWKDKHYDLKDGQTCHLCSRLIRLYMPVVYGPK